MDSLNDDFDNLNIRSKIRYIDLFCGTGGAFSYACSNISNSKILECVFANDIEKSSEDIYKLNHNHNFILGDINDIKPEHIPSFDFLIGGFPTNYVLPNISDSKLYKLAGNAVSVPVVKKIIEQII